MASPVVDDGRDDLFVILTCIDRHEQTENSSTQDLDEVMISTTDVHSWNFPSILRHRIIKVKVHKNRLIECSSYFHGLLGGNFSDPELEALVHWNQPAFLSLLASLFGSPVDVTSENFLYLFEGALYFGMEMVLSKCRMWLTKAISVNGVSLVQLNDLVSIWEFGSELVNYLPELCTSYLAKNFIWAISCSSFGDIPHELLLSSIKHTDLTVDSEKRLCDALLAWIAANKERCTEDICINLLKQIRISLLPLWYAAGKSTYQSLSMCSNESICGAISLLKQPFVRSVAALSDGGLLNLRIRLTEFTEQVDLSGCPQIKPVILLLSMLPCTLNMEPRLRKKLENLYINHELLGVNSFKFSWETWQNLTFDAVHEIDISNCPMLNLEVAIECFSKSFPSLRTLKAANHLKFRTTKVLWMARKCPLLRDVDLTVDVGPIIPTRVSILSSFPAKTSGSETSLDSTGSTLPLSWCYMSRQLPSNIAKLTLDGRIDVNDFDLGCISGICGSLTYLSLKGCTSVSDVGISALIRKCLKLNSIVACDTFFGQQSIVALCSSNTGVDFEAARDSGKYIHKTCNLQMLHMGGCKGIKMASFSELMSQAYMLKSLSLRETQVVDGLFNFFGSSLEVLDVSNTKVSAAAVAHVIGRNPGLKCLKARGCGNLLQQEGKDVYFELGKLCKLDEISAGWGFSYLSLEALKPAISLLKTIEVGLGGSLGHDGLKWLPAICPLLESLVLYFQVISDNLIVNLLESLRHLKSFALCHCFGETSSLCFKVKMPNLRKLRLERVTPWMKNADLVSLSENCANLIDLSLLGCRLLNSESQKIISSGWPGLTSIHLEECGDVTSDGVGSLFDCQALEDILLRHNGSGIQKDFISNAVTKLPMLRKISIDTCDAKDKDFDVPQFEDRHFLSHVKIARCKSQRCAFDGQHVGASKSRVHTETLVLEWDSKVLTTTVVKERV